MTYSPDFRRLAIRLFREMGSYFRAAKICKISTSTLHRWVTCSPAKATHRTIRRRKLTDEIVNTIRQMLIEKQGVMNLHHIQFLLLERIGVRLCIPTISIAVRKLCGFSKKRTCRRFGGKRDIDMHQRLVNTFETSIRERFGDPHRVVSIDECYFSEKVLPLYGYSPIGSKCVVTSPTTSWKKRSLLLAVADDGTKQFRVYEGSINKLRFFDFVMGLRYPPKTTIVLDNVAFHKDVTPMTAKGYRPLFSPPYSPDHNGPVENSFSCIKQSFRSGWPWVGGVDDCIVDSVDRLPPHDIRSMFRNLKNMVA